MPAFIETIEYVFLLIALGYGVARAGILKEHSAEGIADFVFTVAVPLLLFRTMLFADFGEAQPWRLWGAYFAAVALTWTLSHLIIRIFFGRDARSGVVAGVTGAFSNLLLLGIPFVLGVYGADGLAVLSVLLSVHLAVMMAASIILFEWAVRADGLVSDPVGIGRLVSRFFRQLLQNPLIIGIACGLALRLSGLPLPAVGLRLVDALASVAVPLALISVGMGFVRFGVSGQIMPAILLAGVKLLVMPAVALVMALLLDLPPLTAKIVVASASLPAGINSWLIASRFNTGFRLASTAMTLGTAAAAVTTLFWLALAEAVFG